MLNKIKARLEKIKGQVFFQEEDHIYWINGVEYTSVSNTLTYFKKDMDKIPPRILESAIIRGNTIHKIAEEVVNAKGLNATLEDMEELRGEHFEDKWNSYLINLYAYFQKKVAQGWEVLATEQVLFTVPEKICGTMDLVLIKEVDSHIEIQIVDYKTGALRVSNEAQIGIYKFMLEKALRSLKGDIRVSTELISLK